MSELPRLSPPKVSHWIIECNQTPDKTRRPTFDDCVRWADHLKRFMARKELKFKVTQITERSCEI